MHVGVVMPTGAVLPIGGSYAGKHFWQRRWGFRHPQLDGEDWPFPSEDESKGLKDFT